MTAGHHIAHFNWATLRGPWGDPVIEPFETAAPKVNALADRSPGFVWRHVADEAAAAVAIGWPLFVDNARVIASFSVWETPEHFRDYVHKTVHGAFLKRGDAWFASDGPRGYVMWPVPVGHVPDMGEARQMVDRYDAEGPSDHVFKLSDLAPLAETNPT